MRLLLSLRLFHNHHRHIVANRINHPALRTPEACLILLQLDRGLADGTHQDIQ
jgi:hypothetical protein